ncbi:MAG: O-methyltransferase [Oscillospiraceae bacterium]|nr:O-methyltransferase [Oscillospiraceae bacterium]
MEKWTNNDLYIVENLIEEEPYQKIILENSRKNDLPEMEISPTQGKFLYLLAKIKGAKRVLEIGTFVGYSTIWLAKAITDDGLVVSLEFDEHYSEIARRNIELADFSDKVTIITGDAAESLHKLVEENESPFDMIFLDADKPNYPTYLKLILKLSKPGTIIYGDNVIRDGELCNESTKDEKVIGVRNYIESLGKSELLDSTALQTVGIKGYDGFSLSIVK